MSQADEPSEQDSRLEQVLAEILRAESSGTPLDRDELLRAHPDLADELRSFFANRAALERLAVPLQGAAFDATMGLAGGQGDRARIRYFGDYELWDELGRGGMGVVYRAQQTTLKRLVALKMILAGNLADADDVRRFRQEAEAAANLDHPHIAPIYETGEHNGQHYFSMKLIEGQSLREALPELRGNVRAGVTLLEQVARAVHHAHQRGVLHRDLKPANILLDRDGTPYVTDFGLAKRVEGGSDVTKSGAIVGTPSYMAPEQAAGERQLTTAVDVYSLGAMLYELLAGRPPFLGATPLETLLQVTSREAERIGSKVPRAHRDLETIALKCLEKKREKRYGSAEALADDLGRFLRNEPIQARPVGSAERVRRWAQRNPVVATLATGLALVFLFGVAGVVWQWREAVAQRDLAEVRGRENQERVVHQYVAHGAEAFDRGQALESFVWYTEALQQELPEPGLERFHRRRLGALGRQIPRLVHFLPHEQSARAAFSPDGRRIVTYWGPYIRLWDAESGEPVGDPLKQRELVHNVSFSNDSRLLLVAAVNAPLNGDYSGFVATYNTEDGTEAGSPLNVPKLNGWLVKFAPDGTRFLAAGEKRLQGHEVRSQGAAFGVIEHRLPVLQALFSPVGRRLLAQFGTWEGENEVQLYDEKGVAIGEPVKNFELGYDNPFSDDGRYFAAFTSDGTGGRGDGATPVQLHDAETGKVVATVTLPRGVRRMQLVGKEPTLVAYTNDEKLHFVKPLGDKQVRSWNQPLFSFAISPDGVRIAAQRRDNNDVVVFNRESLGGMEYVFPMRGAVDNLVFSPDGQRLLAGERGAEARQGAIHVLDLSSNERVALTQAHFYGTLTAAFSPSGRRVLTADEDGGVRTWDLSALGSTLRPCAALVDQGITVLELSPSEKWLAVGQGHHDMAVDRGGAEPFGLLRVWDFATGKPLGPEIKFPSRVDRLSFAADGPTAAVVLSEGSVALVDVVQGTTATRLSGDKENQIQEAVFASSGELVIHRAPPWRDRIHSPKPEGTIERRAKDGQGAPTTSLALGEHQLARLSPRGDQYLLVRANREAILRDTATGSDRVPLGRLHGKAMEAEFSPDGSRLVLVFDDEVAEIWDVAQARVAARLIRGVEVARFSKEGSLLLTGREGTYRVWDAATGEPIGGPYLVESAINAPAMKAVPALGPGGNSLISTAGDRLREWSLAADERPVEQLVQLAHVMSGHAIDAVAGYSTLAATTLTDDWRGFAASYPLSARAPNEDDVQAWHLREAWQCETKLSRLGETDMFTRPPAHAARHHLSELLKFGKSTDWLARRGSAALLLGDGPAAVADLSAAVEAGESDSLLRLRRARALDRLGKRAEAEADVARAFELGQRELLASPEEWERRAAIRGLTSVLKKKPDDWERLEIRSDFAWELGDYEACLADIDRLLAAGQTLWFLLPRRAACLARLERGPEAIEAFNKALGGKDDDPDLVQGRGFTWARMGEFAKAADDFEKARPLVTNTWRAMRHAAVMRWLAGDEAGYRKTCDTSLEDLKHYYRGNLERAEGEPAAEVARTLALGSQKTENTALMMKLARAGMKCEEHKAFVHETLALALCRGNEPTEALKVLDGLSAPAAADVHAATIRALAYEQLKETDKARESLALAERKFAETPRTSGAEYFLAEVLLKEARERVVKKSSEAQEKP